MMKTFDGLLETDLFLTVFLAVINEHAFPKPLNRPVADADVHAYSPNIVQEE
jgi:hypothetical protein